MPDPKQKSNEFASGSAANPLVVTPVRRDKLASMALASATRTRDAEKQASAGNPIQKRDKFSSMAKRLKIAETKPGIPSNGMKDERLEILELKTEQRRKVFRDLEKAEGNVWNLMKVAMNTANFLTVLKVEQDDVTLSELSSKFRSTLENVHSLLKPHSDFVKSFQNHVEELETKNMYASRVETRLSQERRSVLKDFLRLEESESQITGTTNKRKHSE
jgi:hypothetical protein